MIASGHKRDTVSARVVSFKGTTLQCRLSTGAEGNIHGISFNRQQRRNFRVGDNVSVVVTSEEPFQIALTKEYVKPLLIFDMHGVLGEREPFQKGKPRRFIRRPFCEDFIKFCSERYELAVWSCALKKNIDLKMFQGVKLIFVWTQDESTNLYPYMSVVSEYKPLFLKELTSVWEKFPSYDATNTILLDNHIEKCEKNPLGTCLIVPDFDLEKFDDAVISPQGDIAQHLHAMVSTASTVDGDVGISINLCQYVSERAGTSALFPTSYQSSGSRRLDPSHTDPIPIHVEKIIQESVDQYLPSTTASLKEEPDTCTSSLPVRVIPKPPKKKLSAQMLKVLTSILDKDSTEIDEIRVKHYMPVLSNRHIFHDDIPTIIKSLEDYVVFECSTSDFVWVMVDPSVKQIILFFSDLSAHKLPPPERAEEIEEFDEWMDDMEGMITVFMGELSEAESSKQFVLSIMDVVQINGIKMKTRGGGEGSPGDNCSGSSGSCLLDRMARIQGWLFNSPLDDISLLYNCKPLLVQCKEFTPVSENLSHQMSQAALSTTADQSTRKQSSSAASSTKTGLLFVQNRSFCNDTVALRWRPASSYTVDVSIFLDDLSSALLHQSQESGGGDGRVAVPAVYHYDDFISEILLVSVSTSIISRELTRLIAARNDLVNETCLTSCRLLHMASDSTNCAGKGCEMEVVRFYPMSERRILSVESVPNMRRAHKENIMFFH